MEDMCSFDERMPCVGVFRSGLPMGGLSSSAAWIVQAHENVSLKRHGKAFLHDFPEHMPKPHCDEMPPLPARRVEHIYGELISAQFSIVSCLLAKFRHVEKALFANGNRNRSWSTTIAVTHGGFGLFGCLCS